MKNVTKEMLKIYKPASNLDWLNYKIVKKDLTFHHIVKKEHGGKETLDNGAILMPNSHNYLHIIEYKDLTTYILLNRIFKIVNEQQHEPTQEQREVIEYLLKMFESQHKDDKNSKGKQLIRYQYLKRGFK